MLERRHVLGGAAVTEEVFPGFKFSVCSYVVSLLRPEIIRELDLPRHGLEILPLDGTFTPMPNGDYLWRVNDHAKTRREIARHSQLDAEAYDEYGKAMVEMGRFVKPILAMTPPDPTSLDAEGPAGPALPRASASAASRASDKYNQVQLMTMSAVDFLDQWFETDVLKATMSASGIIGTFLGVRSPGTAYVLLHHYMGEIDGAFRSWGFSRGGTGAISNAIAATRRARPASRSAPRRRSRRSGRRTARRRASCSRTATRSTPRVVSSSVDPRLTFMKMIGEKELPGRLRRGHQALQVPRLVGQGEPRARRACPTSRALPGPGAHLRGAISISPTVEYMERAYDDAKYGRFSRRPYIDMVIPTLTDPSVAPPGQARDVVLRAVRAVQPRRATGTRSARPSATRSSTRSPSTRRTSRTSSCTGRSLTPLDLERELGLSEGNIFQGELTLEQLFFLRPAPGWAQYRTPIRNLYMCGSATHPGGGIMGARDERRAASSSRTGSGGRSRRWRKRRTSSSSAAGTTA